LPDNNHLSEHILERMERIGSVGHWRWNIKDNSLFWSQGVYDIHGLDFEGYTPDVDAALDAYLPEDRNDVEEVLSHAIENKESFKLEKRIKRPNGDIRHIISQGECELCPKTNELVAVFGIVQDITPVKQQEELYELAALGSSAALWDWDIVNDKLRWVGRSAQVLGYALNEQLPQTTEDFFEELLHPDDREIIKRALTNHFTKLENFAIEIRVKRQDGSYEWFSSRAQGQFNDYGKAIRVCGSMTSIQSLKETQDKLKQSNSDLANFASIAAHELKAPIRNVASYLQLIDMSEDETSDTFKDYMNKAVHISNEMTYMIDELLEYASLKDARLHLSEVNLDKITKLIIRSAKEDVKNTGAKISFGELPTIICDETKIKTVITNLIQNAIKYKSDEPPEVHIEVIEDQDYWQYMVRDNGIGMPKEEADNIFTMFKRLSNVGKAKGSGIGLAICERITALHQGDIWAESEVGKGSTFHFTIAKNLDQK